MQHTPDTKGTFSFARRARSLVHAGRGIWMFIKMTHNAWIEIFILIIVIVFSFYLQISYMEWAILVLASGMVFAAEGFNTAIEIDMDLTSPEYHPYAKATKDIAAGAVVISAFTALIVGILIFGHHLL